MSRFTVYAICILFLAFINQSTHSQVGIGTTTPNASSILDITSTTQGVLTPRMTTAQRTAISSPADGLLVYDTDEGAFYYYENSTWNKLQSQIRNNYKLVKSAADLADELTAGGGTTYQLDANTYYEINGTIALAAPIDLNNAYISGLDANEDILVRAGGALFSGSNGGSIRNLTLTAGLGGSIFALTGSGTETLVFQNCIVADSGSVGSISSFGVVFKSIIQLVNNTTGVTYTNIGNVLLSNVAWFDSNTGTFETYVGTFDLIEKTIGFCKVPSGATGIDVSANPTVAQGTLLNTPFSGAGTYIDGYTVGSYTDHFFNNNWFVNCPGLPLEADWVATGDINLSAAVGSGFATTFTGTGTGSRTKVLGTSTSNHLFRFTSSGDNRIVYEGKQAREFSVTASLSFQGDNNNAIFVFYLAKNGTVLEETKVYREVGANNDVGALAIVGTVNLDPTDYIEVWAERFTGGGNLLTVSLNLVAD